jgi:threonine dehydrogenase-like Zn-dependent dehydrogenase
MRALSYEGPRRVRVTNKPDPRIEHPLDAILRVTKSAICGSDLHLLHGLIPDTRIGHTFGHEFTGVVEEVGKGVTNLSVGNRVVVPFPISCGVCFFCSRGLFSNCENSNPATDIASGVFGYSHTAGGYDGGQAEYVRVPYANVGPMKIPEELDDEDVLFLSDALPTGYFGAEMAEVHPGDTVVVFGCGAVGLFAMKSAWLMGAGRVIAVDDVDDRLRFAEKYANVEVLNFRDVDVVAWIKENTEGRGADCTIDAVGCEASGSAVQRALGVYLKAESGSAHALNTCLQATRKGGNVSIVGVYGPPWNLVDIGTAMNKGLTIRTNQCPVHRYMNHLLEHIRSGRIDAAGIISHRFDLEDAPSAYHMFANKLDGCIKCVLTPNA